MGDVDVTETELSPPLVELSCVEKIGRSQGYDNGVRGTTRWGRCYFYIWWSGTGRGHRHFGSLTLARWWMSPVLADMQGSPDYLVGLGFASGQSDQGSATELFQTLCGNLSECPVVVEKKMVPGESVREICP